MKFLNNPYAWLADLKHCCQFLLIDEVKKSIAEADAEIRANPKRIQFTDAEQERWSSLCTAIQKETNPWLLKPHGEAICDFWAAYQRAEFNVTKEENCNHERAT